jgi:hypothetical protein
VVSPVFHTPLVLPVNSALSPGQIYIPRRGPLELPDVVKVIGEGKGVGIVSITIIFEKVLPQAFVLITW